MSAPAVFHERSIWYESTPSVLTTARKCRDAKDPSDNPRPVTVIYLPHRQFETKKVNGVDVKTPLAVLSPHQTTAEEVKQVRDNGGRPGLYTEVRWFPVGSSGWRDTNGNPIADPIVFRKAVSAELVALYVIGDPVMFDWEKMTSQWLIAFLLGVPGQQGWRGKDGLDNGSGTNPGRPFSWTDASFQIGNYSTEVLRLLEKFGAAMFVQLYYNAMQPVEEREDAIREIRDRARNEGITLDIDVLPFYDAAHQPGPNSWRKGCLFTSNRWNYLRT